MEKGKLYMIPNVIADNTHESVIASHIRDALQGIHHFLVEDARTLRLNPLTPSVVPSLISGSRKLSWRR